MSPVCARDRLTGSASFSLSPGAFLRGQGGEYSSLLLSCSSSNEKWQEQESQETVELSRGAQQEKGKKTSCSLAALDGEAWPHGQPAHLWGSILILLQGGAGATLGVPRGRHSAGSSFLVHSSQMARCQHICSPSRRIFMGTYFYFLSSRSEEMDEDFG